MGVCDEPLGTDTSWYDRFWGISHNGRIFHPFKTVQPLSFALKTGSSLSIQYHASSSSQGTLLCDYGQGYSQLFSDMTQEGKPVYPVLLLPEEPSLKPTKVRLYVHPVTVTRPPNHASISGLQSQGKLASGYPNLSPTGSTVSYGIISLLYQLQEKEPWDRALGHVCIIIIAVTKLCIL